jgi:serine protease Do
MKSFPGLSAVLIGTTAALVVLHPAAAFALSRESIAQIALSVTVKIVGPDTGSGVIIKHQGNTYTVLSVGHVVDNDENNYKVITDDGQTHPINPKAIKKFPEGVDLAI